MGVPEPLQGMKGETLPQAQPHPALRPPLTLAEITRLLGAKV
jgi:hypothetical protein